MIDLTISIAACVGFALAISCVVLLVLLREEAHRESELLCGCDKCETETKIEWREDQ